MLGYDIKAVVFDLDDTLINNSFNLTKLKKYLGTLKKKYKLILFSNSSKKETVRKLRFLNADFDLVLARKNFFVRKPMKSVYFKILSKFKLKPNEVLAIGDKLYTDVLGANRMGFISVWLKPAVLNSGNKFFKPFIKPNFVISEIYDLKRYL